MKRIIVILLTGLLLFSCIGCVRVSCAGLSCTVPVRYSNADKYTAGDFTYEETQVKKVEIEWIAGSVTLLNGKGTLSVSESGKQDLSEEEQMHWWLDGTTLKIKYCESGYQLSLSKMEKKDLTVELPAFVDLDLDVASGRVVGENMLDLGRFSLDKASGSADIRFLSAKEISIDTASGGIVLGKVSVSGDFDVDTASGGITIDEVAANRVKVNSASGGITMGQITADSIKIDSASGGITLGIGKASTLRLNSTSGSIRLILTDKAGGARIEFDAVSGGFNTKLPYEKNENVYTIGNGLLDARISVVSGSVTVE